MSEVAKDNWKRLKLLNKMFHRLVFDIGDNSLECFTRATHNKGPWQPVHNNGPVVAGSSLISTDDV